MVAELWESFRSVRCKLCDDFDWCSGVFHQTWPQLDQTTNLELKVLANKKEVARIPKTMTSRMFSRMFSDQSIFLQSFSPPHVYELPLNAIEKYPRKVRKHYVRHLMDLLVGSLLIALDPYRAGQCC